MSDQKKPQSQQACCEGHGQRATENDKPAHEQRFLWKLNPHSRASRALEQKQEKEEPQLMTLPDPSTYENAELGTAPAWPDFIPEMPGFPWTRSTLTPPEAFEQSPRRTMFQKSRTAPLPAAWDKATSIAAAVDDHQKQQKSKQKEEEPTLMMLPGTDDDEIPELVGDLDDPSAAVPPEQQKDNPLRLMGSFGQLRALHDRYKETTEQMLGSFDPAKSKASASTSATATAVDLHPEQRKPGGQAYTFWGANNSDIPEEVDEFETDSASSAKSKVPAEDVSAEARRDSALKKQSFPFRCASNIGKASATSVTTDKPADAPTLPPLTEFSSPVTETPAPVTVFDLNRPAFVTTHPSIAVPYRNCTCPRHSRNLYSNTVHKHELRYFQPGRDTLSLFQHECLDLATTTIASFNNGFLDPVVKREDGIGPGRLRPEQFYAMQGWKRWRKDTNEAQAWRADLKLGEYNPGWILGDVVEIFNQLFFMGELPTVSANSEHLSIQWWPAHIKRRAQTITTAGKDGKSAQTTIFLSSIHPAHVLSPRGLIQTLLHELIHAYLQRHSCYNGAGLDCNFDPHCLRLCMDNFGSTSHGRAWQTLAAAIEDAAPRLLDGFKVDLGQCEAMAQEVTSVGMGVGWWMSECDERRLVGPGGGGWKVRALMRSRDDDSICWRRMKRWVLRSPGCPSERLEGLRKEAELVPKEKGDEKEAE